MDQFIRKHRDGERTHTIYTLEEAEKEGIEFASDWREARQDGWARTTDGYVAQCIKRRDYQSRRGEARVVLRFSFCEAVLPYTREIRWEERRGTRNFGRKNVNWIQMEMSTKRFKRMVKAYVTMYLNGKIDFEMLGKLYRPDQKIPEATVKMLLRREEVKLKVTEELNAVLTGAGITDDALAKLWKDAADIATKSKDTRLMLALFAEMSEIRGWKDRKKVVERAQIDFNEITRAIEGAEEERRELTAKKETETDL